MRRLIRWLFLSRDGYLKLILLATGMVLLKLLAVVAATPTGESIYHISFGFGAYVEGILVDGRYQGCVDGICTSAARMPAQPLFFAAIGVVSTSLMIAALVKAILLSTLVIWSFRYLLRLQVGSDRLKTGVWFFVGGVLVLSPVVLKHIVTVHYEEAFLIEILFVWAFAFLVALRQLASGAAERNNGVVVLAVTLSSLAYLFKSSMILVFALTLLLALCWWLRGHSRAVLVTAVVSLAPMAAWGIHNQVATDHFSVMTSFDGQNSYRGLNSEGRRMYPELYLDRLFDSDAVYTPDGEEIELPTLPDRSEFSDEWSYDQHFRAEAMDWLKANPGEAAQFTLKKAWNYFGAIHKTPYTYDADARDLPTSIGDQVTMAWLLLGRLIWLGMLALLVLLWRTRDRAARWLCLGVVGINATYSGPYLVGFNYERHVTTYLVIVSACVGVLLTEYLHQRGSRSTGTPAGSAEVGESGESAESVPA